MKPDEMKLPKPGAADYQSMMIDLSYETDPPEFQRILPRDQWAVFAHKTYVFQAKKASLQAELLKVQAEMLTEKAKIFLEHTR
jgi:hypothetical protein